MSDQYKSPQEPPTPEEEIPVKPILNLTASGDRMQVELEMLHGGIKTLDPTYKDIMEALESFGVKFGIRENVIQELVAKPVYGSRMIVAHGKSGDIGADGYLKYLIETDRSMRPKEREDGSVDYRDLGFTQNVTKGQPLVEVHNAEKGADGTDVFGQVIEGRFGKEPPSPLGRNTEMDKENGVLIASCDGSASVVKGTVQIIDQLKINGNVDNSTGDITFVGGIQIKGIVSSGFSVKAGGNIIVQGSVEGATLEAGGDIAISEGVNGMGQARIIAGGNIKCKYIQNAFAKSGGDIYCDTVMYSTVECSGNLELTGQRGRLIAGRATVSGYVKAATIGTDSHVPTLVNLNCASDFDSKIKGLNDKIEAYGKEEQRLVQFLTRAGDLKSRGRFTADMIPDVERASIQYTQVKEQREQAQAELKETKEEQASSQQAHGDSYITCKGHIHVGVAIQIGPLLVQMSSSVVNNRVQIIDGEIRFMSN